MKYVFLFLNICCIACNLFAQPGPIGSWQTHFTYNTAQTIELANGSIYAGSMHLVAYDLLQNEFTTYTKVNGLSDVNVALTRYDEASQSLVIVYENSNIDVKQGNKFINIPDIKNVLMNGSKRINQIYFRNKLAYLATDFGVVVIDLVKNEIKQTYALQANANLLSVKDITIYRDSFFVATNEGIYAADMYNPSLQNFANWTQVQQTPANFIETFGDSLIVATKNNLYTYQQGQLHLFYTTTGDIVRLRNGQQNFYVCENNDTKKAVLFFDPLLQKTGETFESNAWDVVELNPNEIWTADGWYGMVKLRNRVSREVIQPNGIFSNATFNTRMLANNLYVCAGGHSSWTFNYNPQGFSVLDPNGNWQVYNRFVGTPALDTISDIIDVALDNRNGYVYASSFIGGLLEFHPDKTVQVFKNNGFIESFAGTYRLVSLAMDKQHNLWMTNYGAEHSIVVKKADQSWQKFKLPFSVSVKTAGELLIDNIDQKWMVAPRGVGVYVLNDNETIDNTNDDKVRLYQKGKGVGNLPNNDVNCLAKDQNGHIWIGTTDGIGIINCPESVFSTDGCEAELKIVKYDLDAGYLFQNEIVNTIAVDGANNKWIGTNNGVWLITDEADKILFRFTKDNSPLPTNEINKITIDPLTGVVYFATTQGLVSFRANATEGETTNKDVLVFPNPVSADYSGTIAIKGLVENADVRITDVAGQLVYRTKAQGGQAVWNGKNYLQQRPRSGVYYVFITNADGTATATTKLIFQE